jgi:NAD-dependent deacetylase
VSKESGLDTFRDVGGHWQMYNPMVLASQVGFAEDPRLVWEWYLARRKNATEAIPNPGHSALAEMEKLFDSFTIFTQNIDRLHHRAGSRNVYELHGNIFDSHCNNCGLIYMNEIILNPDLPLCSVCGAAVRPSVVWFGEQLPEDILSLSYEMAQNSDLFLTIGTSAEVYPAAQLPYLAKESGAYVVEINPNPTSFTRIADLSIQAPSGIALPAVMELVKGLKP